MKSLPTGLISIVLLLTLGFSTWTFAESIPAVEVDAAAALLLDSGSGQILFAQNEQETLIPASLVKVMTMYVAFDQLRAGRVSLEDTTKVSEQAWRAVGSRIFLEPNEIVTIEQLLTGVAVVSGNDACVALAEALAGSEAVYVQWMNEKAKSLGLNLHFVDVHGLSEENRVTALDMGVLVRAYLHDYPEALAYHSQLSFAYQPRSSKAPIVQNNRNGLLRTYEGADGLKTGHLEAAGYNLVGTAVQNNRRLISVILGAPSEARREQDTSALLNYGFRGFDLVNISRFLEDKTLKVYKGKKGRVGVMISEPIIAVPKGIEKTVSVGIQARDLEAPVRSESQVGTLSVYVGEELLKQAPLLAAEEVARGNWFKVVWDTIILFFQDLIKRR